MSNNKVMALKPNVNVRRGTNVGAGILGSLRNGEQLDMVGKLIQGRAATEQWAQVLWPKDLSAIAYVCVSLIDGTEMCRVVEAAPIETEAERKIWNECLDEIHAALVKLRK